MDRATYEQDKRLPQIELLMRQAPELERMWVRRHVLLITEITVEPYAQLEGLTVAPLRRLATNVLFVGGMVVGLSLVYVAATLLIR